MSENDYDELDNTVILTDENGEEVEFEFVDSVDYQGREYVVLLPKEESDEPGAVVILVKELPDGEFEEQYVSVEDDEELEAVFQIFKEKNKDKFDFVD